MNIFKQIRNASFVLAACGVCSAQQLVVGDIDIIQNTNPDRFQLDCTTGIELISNTVNLRQLHDASRQQDIEYRMQVMDVSAGGRTILNVLSATAIPEQFDMGNLRIGRSETWETFGVPGSPVWTFVTGTGMTSYFPLGPFGTWVLGSGALQIGVGTTDALGRFQFRFTMPDIPSLIGVSFTAQSVIQENGVFSITNPDCKEVRS